MEPSFHSVREQRFIPYLPHGRDGESCGGSLTLGVAREQGVSEVWQCYTRYRGMDRKGSVWEAVTDHPGYSSMLQLVEQNVG